MRKSGANRSESSIELSVVIPVFNEQENLHELYRRLTDVLDGLHCASEILFIDDASRDRSLEIIEEFARRDQRVRALSFSRNFGHQTALTAGMNYARGESVVLMDADLQDPPEVIPDLIARLETEAWDVVYAIRKSRKEHPLLRFLYKSFYRLLRAFSYIEIPLDSGDFCVMRRRVVDEINYLPERNRFLRGLRAWVGFRQTGIEYEREERHAGRSKYTARKLVRLALDGFVSFSFLPLRFATWVGFLFAAGGMIYALFIAFARLFFGRYQGLGGWATLVVAILIMGGLQLMMIGVIGEYIGRIFDETKKRPTFIIERFVNFSEVDEAQHLEEFACTPPHSGRE